MHSASPTPQKRELWFIPEPSFNTALNAWPLAVLCFLGFEFPEVGGKRLGKQPGCQVQLLVFLLVSVGRRFYTCSQIMVIRHCLDVPAFNSASLEHPLARREGLMDLSHARPTLHVS